jgi:8-oxo-dGTP pyrophosphatase MutT (NUDIX family)
MCINYLAEGGEFRIRTGREHLAAGLPVQTSGGTLFLPITHRPEDIPMSETFVVPVVCIVVPQAAPDGTVRVLVQRRLKKEDGRATEYAGLWELPQGKIRQGETIFEAATRELREETGLRALSLWTFHDDRRQRIVNSDTETIIPLICSVDTTLNYLGVGVLIVAEGSIQQTQEASDHQWLTRTELDRLMEQNEVFPLNVPILRHFFSHEDRKL